MRLWYHINQQIERCRTISSVDKSHVCVRQMIFKLFDLVKRKKKPGDEKNEGDSYRPIVVKWSSTYAAVCWPCRTCLDFIKVSSAVRNTILRRVVWLCLPWQAHEAGTSYNDSAVWAGTSPSFHISPLLNAIRRLDYMKAAILPTLDNFFFKGKRGLPELQRGSTRVATSVQQSHTPFQTQSDQLNNFRIYNNKL